MSDDFYIGYMERAPAPLARFLRLRVLLLILAGAGLGAVLVATQGAFPRSRFEFGTTRSLQGTYRAEPAPTLELEHPLGEGSSRVLLVAPGKFGAGPLLAGQDGQRVELIGTLVYRDGVTMLEVATEGVTPLGESTAPKGAPSSLGERVLRGEIVDSKCYLGVMKPGRGKPHRACAVRCISGGIPPVLMVRDTAGIASYFLLTDLDGGALNDRILDLVAEPVEIRGEVLQYDNLLVLRAAPRDIQRLP